MLCIHNDVIIYFVKDHNNKHIKLFILLTLTFMIKQFFFTPKKSWVYLKTSSLRKFLLLLRSIIIITYFINIYIPVRPAKFNSLGYTYSKLR